VNKMMWLMVAFLVIGVVTLYVSIGTMLAKYKPYGVASISALVGAIYVWLVETKTNFSEYILTPAIETLSGVRGWDLYGLGTVVMLFGLIAVVLVAFFNAIVTWSRDTPFSLWR